MANGVMLRDIIESDLALFFQQQLDPDATRMAGFPARAEAAFMAHWSRILNDELVEKKAILFNAEVAGYIVSWEQSGQRLVGYWLGKAYWGKQIATRGLRAFLAGVKQRPLYAYVVRHNLASRRVLEKCGFTVCHESPEEYLLCLDEAEGSKAQGPPTRRSDGASADRHP